MKAISTIIALAAFALAGSALAEEALKPVNTKCPISGEEADGSNVVAYTKVVGVCCEKCQAKVTKKPGDSIEKIAKVEAKIVNSKCPISGEDIDSDKVVDFNGAKVAVCCGKCEKNFDAEKHGAKVVMDVAGNDKCIFSNEDIDADAHAVVSFRVAVCCGKCEKKFAGAPDDFIGKVEFAKAAE
ncbi:MAG: hypothetical protein AAF514_07525 [Verrucomicrobiota bacterium]